MGHYFKNEPIKIESPTYGVMEFSELLFKDFSWLEKDQTQKLPAREFAVELILAHLITPQLDIEEVRNWSDDELSWIVIQWMNNQQKESTLPDTATFEDIKNSMYEYFNSLTGESRKQLETLFESQRQFINDLTKSILPATALASSMVNLKNAFNLSQMVSNIVLPQISSVQEISKSIKSITGFSQQLADFSSMFQRAFASTQMISSLSNALASSLPKLDISTTLLNTKQFFAGLPDLTELGKILKEAEEGGEAFKNAGFSFITVDYVSLSTVRRYASISQKVRSAAITNRLAADTRGSEFEQKLGELFNQSSVLRRRWPIVSQAIKAHRRREYNISVPALLAQVEGVIGDALILNGLIISKGHKLYAKGSNGKAQLDKKGVPIEVRGVGTLIQRSTWQTHPALQGVADLITNQLAGERNPILHGRRTNYGVARLSVQGLLLLFVLAAEVVVFETGKIP